jgi:RNA polymerase sigma-70 factor, ECF subfamily
LELDENLNVSSGRSPAQELLISSDIETVKKAILLLPAQYREIIELRFILDIDPKICAKLLKKNPVSIRVLQYRALSKLKEVLEKSYVLESNKI